MLAVSSFWCLVTECHQNQIKGDLRRCSSCIIIGNNMTSLLLECVVHDNYMNSLHLKSNYCLMVLVCH